ncbi:uncharacterized protein LOC141817471 [Curcuma longa]|uniref:uncharacterized protein LOC141817471 n=1 Tax=Curcuma longa TaxID=136217 RepID=UPI003D9DE08F
MNNFGAITGVAGGHFGSGAGERRYQVRGNPSPPTALKCPRCNSANTKFCYYNNYNLAQPRYFCKACRRYWTKGGVLRNIPVGGGCRRSKRSSVSSSKCSAGLPSEKDLLPSGRASADDPNSVALVSNPDSIPSPEPDFNQATATETPSLLIHEAEIFAETIAPVRVGSSDARFQQLLCSAADFIPVSADGDWERGDPSADDVDAPGSDADPSASSTDGSTTGVRGSGEIAASATDSHPISADNGG